MKELSAKQKKFVHEWLIDLCGTRAAIRAGYSEKSAAQTASRLMKDPAVREYRDALLKEEFDSLGITRHSLAVEVWRGSSSTNPACGGGPPPPTPVLQWDSNMRDYIESGDWQFDSKGCLKALGMLNGMLERIERSEDADAADGYETMLSGGGREF